ncbi:hypothetical protein TraAM80_03069, partial [Trypanosoma rangeli]
ACSSVGFFDCGRRLGDGSWHPATYVSGEWWCPGACSSVGFFDCGRRLGDGSWHPATYVSGEWWRPGAYTSGLTSFATLSPFGLCLHSVDGVDNTPARVTISNEVTILLLLFMTG